MTINLTSTQIAQLTAIIKGETGYKRAASKDAAASRFRAALSEKIGDLAADARAENILGAASYDEAADFLRIAMSKAAPTVDLSELAEAAANHDAEEAAAEEADQIAVAKTKFRRAAIKVAEKTEAAPKADKPIGKRAAILAAAEAGELPTAPDFSAETHKRFRGKLAEVVALAEAGNIKGLKAFEINPVSSSPKAIAKYRDLCIIALEARKAKGKAA